MPLWVGHDWATNTYLLTVILARIILLFKQRTSILIATQLIPGGIALKSLQGFLSEVIQLFSRARLFATTWRVACTKLLRPWDFQGKRTGVGCHFLLQGIFPTQGSNPGLSHCRQTLYRLSHLGSQRLVITFLPRSKHLFISWLQSPSSVILEPKKIISIFSPPICYEVIGLHAIFLVFWMLSFKPTFSLSSLTFIKKFFSSSPLSGIRVVSSAYLRLLIFLLVILIPACASSSPAFIMNYYQYLKMWS